MKLIMENVRCFAGRHEIPIKPLTLLVGENSTGKTTVLAMAALARSRSRLPIEARLNEPPFSLGSYNTIATYKGGRYGRSRSFVVGWEEDPLTVEWTLVSDAGQPKATLVRIRWDIDRKGTWLDVAMTQEAAHLSFHISGRTIERVEPQLALTRLIWQSPLDPSSLLSMLTRSLEPEWESAVSQDSPKPWPPLRTLQTDRRPVRAFAPVRTYPRRTYDEFYQGFSPEGEHLPLALLTSTGEQRFQDALNEFGSLSGLFSSVATKRLGKQPADPLQILVQTGGPNTNLVDVGYGVSQALPLIVEALRAPQPTLFLLQQPEVHLHPRAQAAMGTFFVRLAHSHKHSFVVETHSDYIVDRVRLEVARGNIAKEDVALLWFDKPKLETHVHEIRLDAQGNVVDPPPGYRAFFLQEELALLTRGSRQR